MKNKICLILILFFGFAFIYRYLSSMDMDADEYYSETEEDQKPIVKRVRESKKDFRWLFYFGGGVIDYFNFRFVMYFD